MKTLILTFTLLASTVSNSFVLADQHFSKFSATDLVDANLDDRMVDLAQATDQGEAALTQIIEDIETRNGQFSPVLYGYLHELGRIKQANQEHRAAIDLFQRMQTLTHWADGVYSPLQMESIRLQSLSQAALGKLREADRLERFHLHIAERSASQDSDLIAALWRLGDWQRASLQYRKALEQYERALAIIDSENMTTAYRVRTLKAKALTEYLTRACCADETLGMIADLSEADAYSDAISIREAQLNAADMSVIRGRRDAIQHYAGLARAPAAFLGPRNRDQIIAALDRAENPMNYNSGKEVVHFKQQATVVLGKTPEPISTFSTGDPVRLCATDASLFEAKDSYVDVSIDLSPEGEPANIEISGSAPNKLKRYLRSTLVKSAYRPEIADGKPRPTTLTFRQHFNKTRPLKSANVSEWRGILTEHACQIVAAR